MIRRMILAVVFGLAGCAVLVALGVWQLERLQWKRGILADIEARIHADPVAVPSSPDPEEDRYLPVRATGTITDTELRVLAGLKGIGPGHRIVAVFETDGRRLLLDRGFLPERAGDPPRPPVEDVTVTGNLRWPDETDSFTPPPDREAGLWFARDVPAMADALDTEPVLIVARKTSEAHPPVMPLPLDTAGIPNDHLEYAATWFTLALGWLGMTALLVWRIRRRTD